jgi:hypothetical protein
MHLDLTYLPCEDRMLLTVRGKAAWLLTRKLLVRVVVAWLKKLELVDLPHVGFELGKRNIELEHSLSLEFDDLRSVELPNTSPPDTPLLSEVTLRVDSFGATVVLRGGKQTVGLTMTRKEAHLVLEMLAFKARSAGWATAVAWPDWLGYHRKTL